MSGSINKIESVAGAVQRIVHLDCMAFDCYASFPFKLHVVKHLRLQILCRHCVGVFQQSVGKGAFAMVYMSYYTEVAYILHLLCVEFSYFRLQN